MDLIHSSNPIDKIKGAKQLHDLIKNLPQMFSECKGAEQDFTNIFNALKQFDSFKIFALHILEDVFYNRTEVVENFKTMMNDWNNKDYKAFGNELGRLVEEIVVGNAAVVVTFNQEKSPNTTVQVIEGVLKGFGSAYSPSFEECLKDGTLDLSQYEKVIFIQTFDILNFIKNNPINVRPLK